MVYKYPIFDKNNISAYAIVLGLWVIIAVLIAVGIYYTSGRHIEWRLSLVWSFVSVMAGMSIMFGASVVNLRKLRAGFKRLASGAADPDIPRVWCPVLTMATRAAVELSEQKNKTEI